MAWLITKDHFDAGGKYDSTGVNGPSNASAAAIEELKAGKGHKFQMKDDDGELLIEGLSSAKDSFAPLDDYGGPGLGCTMIFYWTTGKGGGWKQL